MEKVTTPPSVLIVDDEPMLRSLFADAFTESGFVVHEAENGRAALASILAGSFDVVVSDVRMPGGSGLELLAKLRTLNVGNPPVVFVTGFANADVEQVYASGADAVFYKPFKQKDLVDAATALVRPLAERWAELPTLASAPIELKGEHPSLETASQTNQLSVGRGGVFLALAAHTMRPGDAVKFNFGFDGGSLARLEGVGIVRWVRNAATEHRPSGAGIEIRYLSDGCRAAFLALESRKTSVAFIPSP